MVKAYAHEMKDYFENLAGRGADWRRLRLDELAGCKLWLRLSLASPISSIGVCAAAGGVDFVIQVRLLRDAAAGSAALPA